MGYKYKVDMGYDTVDLDELMAYITGKSPQTTSIVCQDYRSIDLPQNLMYWLGSAGYKFVVDTLQAQVDNIKARQPGAEQLKSAQFVVDKLCNFLL